MRMRSITREIVLALVLISSASSARGGILFAETPQYTVTVVQPPSDLPIAFHSQQTTRYAPDGAFVMEVGPGQVQTTSLRAVAQFQAKPGFVLTGVTMSGAATAEAWEGSYSVGGSWNVGSQTNPSVAAGTFPTVGNSTYNQNAAVEFPPAVMGHTAGTLLVDARLQLRVAGSAADCGRAVCARIGAPSLRFDIAWAAVPPPPAPSTMPLGLGALVVLASGVAIRSSRRSTPG